jgi:hypothetical protein
MNILTIIRRMTFVGCIGLAVALSTGNQVLSQTEPKFVTSPTPSSDELFPPGPDVPTEIASWFGRWQGEWDGKWPLVFAVTEFERRDNVWFARVLYYRRERLTEPYRSRQGSNDWFRVTPTEIRMNTIDIYRNPTRPQRACANGAFSTRRSATLFWSSHNTEFQANKNWFLRWITACDRDLLG